MLSFLFFPSFRYEKEGKEGKTMSKNIDVSFMHDLEPTELKIVRRRVPLRHDYLKGKDAEAHVTEINQLIYFYRFFETRLAIKKGDVFLARFGFECGNELSGNHYVVALLDSNPISQVVTVVPLKSAKGRALNPASDIMIGEIEKLGNSKEAIAVINQIRTIDKRRLFDAQVIAHLSKYMSDEMIGEYSELTVQIKRIYRLTNEQFKKIHKAAEEYVYNGYIKHNEF